MGKKNKLSSFPYTNRELSWLSFNERVLNEAYEKDKPILERLKFLSISASNLDEFFMVRVAGIKEQIRLGFESPDNWMLPPSVQFKLISERSHDFMKKQYECLSHSIIPVLKNNGIAILKPEELNDSQKKFVCNYFKSEIFSVLTPLAINPNKPFPILATKNLHIIVRLKNNFVVIRIPSYLPRFLKLPDEQKESFILMEDVIISNLQSFFNSNDIKTISMFRIIRNQDMEVDDDADDLLIEMQNSIKKRKRGKPVRLEINTHCDPATRQFLIDKLNVKDSDIYKCPGPIDLSSFSSISELSSHDELKEPEFKPAPAIDFEGCEDIFSAIRKRDRFVHLPYESFDCVLDFLSTAAEDPKVIAIKQTLYRVGGSSSPIVAELMKAAKNGKQVTVLVELKARFDEEHNINWAKKLENAGCHVVYGVPGLKTHCKILQVIRKDSDRIRSYLHLGTGNYNASTAKQYTDMGIFTCREDYGNDATLLFNRITGYLSNPQYDKLIVAPENMREFFYDKIDNERKNAKKGKDASITIKVNSLLDAGIVKKLYKASVEGVKINLIVRGICSLVPGVKNVSENIKVISIVGKFLEHSRIFKFENDGDPEIYIGSADLMPRNLDKRIELIFPVEEKRIIKRINDALELMLSDNVNARIQHSDTSYSLIESENGKILNSQEELSMIRRQTL